MFALLMIGIGALFFAIGGVRYLSQPTILVPLERGGGIAKDAHESELFYTIEARNWSAIRSGLLGFVFVALGTAMNVGLRRVVAKGSGNSAGLAGGNVSA